MRAGKLDKKVVIKQKQVVRDSFGQESITWAVFATVWGDVKDLSGKEYVAAAAVKNPVTTEIRIRYTAGVLPAMRAEIGAVVYNIKAVLGQDRVSQQLMCERQD